MNDTCHSIPEKRIAMQCIVGNKPIELQGKKIRQTDRVFVPKPPTYKQLKTFYIQ